MRKDASWDRLIEWSDQRVRDLGMSAPLDFLADFVAEGISICPVIEPVATDQPVPYGRYLIHADPSGNYNIQLDVFSKNYQGFAHAHETWGAFWVLRGRLRVLNWETDAENRPTRVVTQSLITRGSGSCFSPPVSDWHEVRVEEPSDQVFSIHVYGKEFDLDRGIYMDKEGRIQQGPRGLLKHWQELAGYIRFL